MILYFDPFMGMAGDMTVAALVDAGAAPETVNGALRRLGLGGLAFRFQKVLRQGLSATFGRVELPAEHGHRGLSSILSLIEGAGLPAAVSDLACEAFRRLGEAEAKVHGVDVETVHFHEVGAADAIADIVGACAAWEALGGPEVECGPMNLGSGFTTMEHGTFPVPPPAVVEILKGVPVFSAGAPLERTTPTGAALAVTLARRFGPLPRGRIAGVGYGAGSHDSEGAPNVLRALLVAEEPADGAVAVIETQVDDTSPELLAGALEAIRAQGALDLFLTPVVAKKGRPGCLVTLLCGVGEESRFADLLLEHTSTTGVRFTRWERRELPREVVSVATPRGPVRVKRITAPSGARRSHIEWEDLRALSEGTGVPALLLLQELETFLK